MRRVDGCPAPQRKDLYAGLVFLLLGLGAMLVSTTYTIGTATQMGPGYFPMSIGGLLALLGLVQVVGYVLDARRASQHEGDGVFGASELRPFLFTIGGVIVFAATVKWLGVIVSIPLQIYITSLAERRRHWVTVTATALVLTIFVAVVFVGIFGVRLPILPAGF